jgi:ABC-type uncharacterized transport system permease subunit
VTTESAADSRTSRSRRISAGVAAIAVVGAGLLVHARVGGDIGDILGDALYAVLIYLLITCALPRLPIGWVAAAAIVVCSSIELLQLTSMPRDGAELFPPIALVLGSGFDPRDLVVYAGAVAVVALIDGTVRSLARRRDTQEGALPKESAL